jgi:hypothetical protein
MLSSGFQATVFTLYLSLSSYSIMTCISFKWLAGSDIPNMHHLIASDRCDPSIVLCSCYYISYMARSSISLLCIPANLLIILPLDGLHIYMTAAIRSRSYHGLQIRNSYSHLCNSMCTAVFDNIYRSLMTRQCAFKPHWRLDIKCPAF